MTSASARLAALIPLATLAVACGTNEFESPPCAVAPLATCVDEYSEALAACYTSTGAACAADDAGPTAALDTLAASLGDCTVGALDRDATRGRLQNACASEAGSIAWRSFGGPQGAAWADADDAQRTCLTGAHEAAVDLAVASLTAIDACAADGDCSELAGERSRLEREASAAVDGVCGLLPNLVAVDTPTFVDRAARQVDCMTAAAYAETEPLDLRCGPSHAQFDAPRGDWTLIPVDSEIWGTRCGNGSDYAFWVRLAPEGEPLDRLVIALQGGGVCFFEDDCAPRIDDNPSLFDATDDLPPEAGIMSTEPADNPFANYTMAYLPYCTQDVFAGGGVDEELGALTLPRFGAVNARAAVQMIRDVIWRELDAEGGAGFRSDEVTALFGGFSAGGYGTLYNYHWFLDDLLWPRTAAFPDAGLALDNGESFGVRSLGLVKIPAWGTRPYLPPYCFDSGCAVGEDIYRAISPRLKTVPEQQFLITSNPLDTIQEGDAFFGDSASFINELRASYCRTRDLDGIQYYFTSVSDEPVHVVTIRPELWESEVDGVTMRDWFQGAIESPDAVVDRAEEADFVDAVKGVEPYPCDVAP